MRCHIRSQLEFAAVCCSDLLYQLFLSTVGFCARKSLLATDLLRSVIVGGASCFVD
ncbi:hypothetical protein Hdeb2414_s0010g00341641 [Helianthus debilis subsp. tardiflorus]